MAVLNPRCSLNHLAILPVHRSEVIECCLSSSVWISAARNEWRGPRVTLGQPTGSGARRQARGAESARLVRRSDGTPAESHGDSSALPRRNSVTVTLPRPRSHAHTDIRSFRSDRSVPTHVSFFFFFPDYATHWRARARETRLPLPPPTCPPHT